MMMRTGLEAVRPPAVAGLFYPANPDELRLSVDRLLENVGPQQKAEAVDASSLPTPKALIAPHAGYVYSGIVAGAAYRLLTNARGKIARVVLLGPSHRFAFSGMAATGAYGYETPLGVVPVDQQWLDRAHDVPLLRFADEAHEGEHCLETQLPFLQRTLGDFKLAPIICGQVSGDLIADLLDRLWGGPETLIVVSSDLSHYLDYETCRALDATTCAAIERLDAGVLTPERACGATPVNGLLIAARRRGMKARTLDLRNSGDTAGSRNRVVGYGAWAFWEDEKTIQSDDDDGLVRRHGALMNDVARRAICGAESLQSRSELPSAFNQVGASFVTLHRADHLRGCCGSIAARRPLVEDIAANALKSAFEDPRFTPLAQAEWTDISLSVTVLSSPTPMSFDSEAELLSKLQPHRDGLIIEDGGRRALFLPAVWEMLPGQRDFLAHLKAKAGLAPDHWSSTLRASRFSAAQTAPEKLLYARSGVAK